MVVKNGGPMILVSISGVDTLDKEPVTVAPADAETYPKLHDTPGQEPGHPLGRAWLGCGSPT